MRKISLFGVFLLFVVTVPFVLTSAPRLDNSVATSGSVSFGLDINQFDSDITPSRLSQALALSAAAGASYVRLSSGGGWSAIEQSGPTSNWSSFDQDMALVYKYGLKILLEMGNEPAWDAYNQNSDAPPSDCVTYSSPQTRCQSVSQYVGENNSNGLVYHLVTTDISGTNVPEINIVEGLIPRNEPQNYSLNWQDPNTGGAAVWAVDYAYFQQAVYVGAHSFLNNPGF